MLKKQLLFVFAFIMFLTSCNKDEVALAPVKDVKIEMAQHWFENQQIKLPRSLFNDLQGKLFAPKWDLAVNYANDTINNVVCYSIPLTETQEGKWYMNIAITDRGNNAEYVNYRKFATQNGALSGVLNYYTIYGSFKESEILKDGKISYVSRDKDVEGSDMMAEDNSCTDTRGLTLSCGGGGDSDGIGFSVTYSGPEIVVTAPRPDPIVIGNIGDRGGSIITGGNYSDAPNINVGGGGGGPSAPKDIINEVTDPCLKAMIDESLSKGLKNKINSLLTSIFNKNDQINLKFIQTNHLANSTLGEFVGYGYGTYQIELNGNVLPSASKEIIAATVIHEALHAYMQYTGITKYFNDHDSMGASYVNGMATALKEMFPNLTDSDANALAWGGLHESMAWSQLLIKNPTLTNNIVQTNLQYVNKQKGTGCK